jgi:hypothetical protein
LIKELLNWRIELALKVLVACEFSGTVRDAFIELGHDAMSCDLLPSDSDKGPHYQGDVLDILYDGCWDLLISHPPCTYLCNSGVHLLKKEDGRIDKMVQSAIFFRTMLKTDIKYIAVENPVMFMVKKFAKFKTNKIR